MADWGNLKIYFYWNCKSNYESGTRSTAQPVYAGWTVRGSLTDGAFSLLCHAQTGSAFHQASSSPVARDSVSRVNRPERERDHSQTSGAEAKNRWSWISTRRFAWTAHSRCDDTVLIPDQRVCVFPRSTTGSSRALQDERLRCWVSIELLKLSAARGAVTRRWMMTSSMGGAIRTERDAGRDSKHRIRRTAT